jgi:hypothetical protein
MLDAGSTGGAVGDDGALDSNLTACPGGAVVAAKAERLAAKRRRVEAQAKAPG